RIAVSASAARVRAATTDREESAMARLIYSAIASLGGYVEDEQGTFDWAAPDDQVLAAVQTSLSGRSAPTSTAAGCTKPWSSGRRPAPALISRPGCGTSPSSGGSRRRSSTPGRLGR